MQKDYALFNLKEARDAIDSLIAEMTSDPEYDIGKYMVDTQHIYWHINSAWNGRQFNMTSHELSDEMYETFVQFPKDLAL